MQSLCDNERNTKVLGPTLGDQQQGSFSINLWRNAFEDALLRLCPVRSGGHDCGCLPVLGMCVNVCLAAASFTNVCSLFFLFPILLGVWKISFNFLAF